MRVLSGGFGKQEFGDPFPDTILDKLDQFQPTNGDCVCYNVVSEEGKTLHCAARGIRGDRYRIIGVLDIRFSLEIPSEQYPQAAPRQYNAL